MENQETVNRHKIDFCCCVEPALSPISASRVFKGLRRSALGHAAVLVHAGRRQREEQRRKDLSDSRPRRSQTPRNVARIPLRQPVWCAAARHPPCLPSSLARFEGVFRVDPARKSHRPDFWRMRVWSTRVWTARVGSAASAAPHLF